MSAFVWNAPGSPWLIVDAAPSVRSKPEIKWGGNFGPGGVQGSIRSRGACSISFSRVPGHSLKGRCQAQSGAGGRLGVKNPFPRNGDALLGRHRLADVLGAEPGAIIPAVRLFAACFARLRPVALPFRLLTGPDFGCPLAQLPSRPNSERPSPARVEFPVWGAAMSPHLTAPALLPDLPPKGRGPKYREPR